MRNSFLGVKEPEMTSAQKYPASLTDKYSDVSRGVAEQYFQNKSGKSHLKRRPLLALPLLSCPLCSQTMVRRNSKGRGEPVLCVPSILAKQRSSRSNDVP